MPVLELDERLHFGDLASEVHLDSEALCLCGVLWSTPAAARRVVDLLQGEDFTRNAYADLLALIRHELERGRPQDPASVAAALAARGGAAHQQGRLRRALAEVTTAGAIPELAGHHAVNVLTAAYRRSYRAAATALTQAAEELATDDLFTHLLTIGRTQRTATTRLQHARQQLDTSTSD